MTPLVVLAAACAALGVLLVQGAGRPTAATPPRGSGRARTGAGGAAPRAPGRPGPPDGALVLDLVAAVVEAGAPPTAAALAVAALLTEAGWGGAGSLEAAVEPPAAGPPARVAADDGLELPLRRCLALAEQTGAPVAALLRSAADELRRRRRRRAALAAARLGVRVVAPLGLCTLPAFALLGVVPVLLSLGGDLLG